MTMNLPDCLQERRFTEWNEILKGIMVLWDMACLLGLEQDFEARLRSTENEAALKRLGRLGNQCAPALLSLRQCAGLVE
jgi:hypothetical protein